MDNAFKFEWNDLKNKSNHKKHDVWFEEAKSTWEDFLGSEYFDTVHSIGEERFIRIGQSFKGRFLLTVFTHETESSLRIISSRPLFKGERKQYEEGI